MNNDTDNGMARLLVGSYYDIQKQRIESNNQMKALERAGADAEMIERLKSFITEKLELIEKNIKKEIKTWVEGEPVYDLYLKDVKGIGPILAAGLIAHIGTPTRFANPSKLWAYAGLAPGQKRKRGVRCNWNTRLKTLLWKVGESFVKGGDEYRKLYEEKRAYYDGKYPENSKGYNYAMAKRKVVKRFLVELWVKWWEIETGRKAPKKAYVIDKLGHEEKAI